MNVASGAAARPGDVLALRLLAGEPLEMAALQRVLEAALGYFQIVTGGPSEPAEPQSTFTSLPPGVVASNPGALDFWRKLGYCETGEVKPAGPDFLREVIVLEKPIARSPARGA